MSASKVRRVGRPRTASRRRATYSLPGALLEELDRRTAGRSRAKSGIVAEALAQYFTTADRLEREAAFDQAARDPLFMADNASVLRDFAGLDGEVARRRR